MIIFLYGPDAYPRAKKKKSIVAEFEKKHSGLSIGEFDIAEDGALDAFRHFVRNQSIFEPVKLAVVENFFELEAKEIKKELEQYASESGLTIILSEKDSPVKALDFLLKKPVISQEFKYLTGKAYQDFIDA